MTRWRIGGTDLGIPYVLENGSIGYLFGDTFDAPGPVGRPGWRSPTALRSAISPGAPTGIIFDSAFKVNGNGFAPEIMFNQYRADYYNPWGTEFTVIPNDGISFPETGRQIVSYMSINRWKQGNNMDGIPGLWRTNYAGLAFTDNGNDFTRLNDLIWWNNEQNTDGLQMVTMRRDPDGYVYLFSVRAGRQHQQGMFLTRVKWDRMFWKNEYEGWGFNGRDWAWGRPSTPILVGSFGEPSIRRFDRTGIWVMCYLNLDIGAIVTRTAPLPIGPWSPERVQVTSQQESFLYGGFIHPWSQEGENNLHILVSTWKMEGGTTTAYHVSQYVGTV